MRFAIASPRVASGEAASRKKNNDCSQSKFCRNIVYVSSTVRISPSTPTRSTKFGSKQSEKEVTSLRDSHAHVLAISKFCPYEYKQALFCMIAGAVLCILC